jgi:hypothetical protein
MKRKFEIHPLPSPAVSLPEQTINLPLQLRPDTADWLLALYGGETTTAIKCKNDGDSRYEVAAFNCLVL